jgi:UDP-N-acetylglucosamine transferase subunit ALG13
MDRRSFADRHDASALTLAGPQPAGTSGAAQLRGAAWTASGNQAQLPRREKLVLVASTGGHLAQLLVLADMLELDADSLWVTFDSPQSRSLLAGRRVAHVPYIKPRGGAASLRAALPMSRLMQADRFDGALSTGSAIAVPALLSAVAHRLPAYYVESISRFDGPSLSGRILARAPGVRCFTQHAHWADSTWTYDVSIADRLRSGGGVRAVRDEGRPPRVFVTLGTIAPYRFDALVDNLLAVLPAGSDITWQTGSTSRTDLPGDVWQHVTTEEFDRLATEADLVVAHAGVGSLLRLLDLGVAPLIVPRRRGRGEHVDDHQQQVAGELARAGLVQVRQAGDITYEDLAVTSWEMARPAA